MRVEIKSDKKNRPIAEAAQSRLYTMSRKYYLEIGGGVSL